MAFDAGMVSAIVWELNQTILGARVEKVTQPEKDEIVLLLHIGRENIRLSLSSGSNNPHFNITSTVKENPMTAPMFCMLLRKHLTGSKLTSIKQLGFERAVEFGFDGFDEMGFPSMKYLVTETMGKYSNVILLNGEKKVVSALKIIDLAASSVRQILPGFPYELPPVQKKFSPLTVSREEFLRTVETADDMPADKFLAAKFYGLSALSCRETVCRVSDRNEADCPVSALDREKFWNVFETVRDNINNGIFEPWLVADTAGRPVEYSFIEPIEYRGGTYEIRRCDSFGILLDEYFGRRDKAERIKQRTADIFRLLSNAESRLQKKISLQKQDLSACADKDKYKLWGDLLTANIWQLKRGQESCTVENYFDPDYATVKIPLDKRLTPQQNAQRYYKKYNKSKTAEVELTKQIAIAGEELDYLYTVFDSLTKAESESDILEIRDELYRSGYAAKMKNYTQKKLATPKLSVFCTTDGKKVLCGKNNHQNDYLTTRVAGKLDYWFHVKNQPGSHCVLFCDDGEPSERDFTEAAMIAAYYSKASEGQNVAVDYTLIKNIRKPNGAKPGFVTYQTNYTAYVTPNERAVLAMKK